MAHPQDGGDGLRIGRLAANILNRQSRTADKGRSCSMGVEESLRPPHRSKSGFYEMLQRALDGFLERPTQWKTYMRLGTWTARRL
jgi:hypothetical protein